MFSPAYLLFASLNAGLSPPEKGCGWWHLLKWRNSCNQNHKLSMLWKTLLVLLFLHILLVVWILPWIIPQGGADCVGEHLLQVKWGCFCTLLWIVRRDAQLDPMHLPATHLPSVFLKGAHNAQSSMWPIITFLQCLSWRSANYNTVICLSVCFFLPRLVSVNRKRRVTWRPMWNGSIDSAIL